MNCLCDSSPTYWLLEGDVKTFNVLQVQEATISYTTFSATNHTHT